MRNPFRKVPPPSKEELDRIRAEQDRVDLFMDGAKTPFGKELIKYLKEWQTKHNSNLRMCKGEQLSELQGMAKMTDVVLLALTVEAEREKEKSDE
jgi:hypothetical protein